MSHAHVSIEQLVKHLEQFGKTERDTRPGWLITLIEQTAELFEPLTDVGRVGFECLPHKDRWQLSMYLGSTEYVGGRDDGQIEQVDFQFDLLALTKLFSRMHRLSWSAFPAMEGEDGEDLRESSYITADAEFDGHPVRLRIYCTAPVESGPGLRFHADGRWEST